MAVVAAAVIAISSLAAVALTILPKGPARNIALQAAGSSASPGEECWQGTVNDVAMDSGITDATPEDALATAMRNLERQERELDSTVEPYPGYEREVLRGRIEAYRASSRSGEDGNLVFFERRSSQGEVTAHIVAESIEHLGGWWFVVSDDVLLDNSVCDRLDEWRASSNRS